MPVLSRWERKSVSQLVQHYQSCSDLRSIGNYNKSQKAEDSRWRRDHVDLFRGGHTLSRSRSMEVLPQKGVSGTKALRDLFESKGFLQNSNSLQNINLPSGGALLDWKIHKNQNHQRSIDIMEAMNGHPESQHRGSGKDNKNSIVTKGSPIQGRNRIPTSSSVRDRSALYLSRTADATRDSEQPESICSPQEKKTRVKKFQFPAREICSACLTPVYPMEKMVANKVTLHRNCFCCRHCKKKLGIHNYSSLYGEFYCISHYQQLFKRKGNYDEGFGHVQHKERWIQKSTDEPDDTKTTPKATKNKVTSISVDRKSLNTAIAPAKELTNTNNHNAKGKLKISWPPGKKSPGNQVKLEKNETLQVDKPATPSITKHKQDDHKQVKTSFLKTKADMPDAPSTKTADFKGQPKNSAEQLYSVPLKSISLPRERQYTYDKTKLHFQTQPEKSIIVTKLSTHSAVAAAVSKSNKVKKSVHFAEVDTPKDDTQSKIVNEEMTSNEKVSLKAEQEAEFSSSSKSNKPQLPLFERTAFNESTADIVNQNDKPREIMSIYQDNGFWRNTVIEIDKDSDVDSTKIQSLNQHEDSEGTIEKPVKELEEIVTVKSGNMVDENCQVEMVKPLVKTEISVDTKGSSKPLTQDDKMKGNPEISIQNVIKENDAEGKTQVEKIEPRNDQIKTDKALDAGSSPDAHTSIQNISVKKANHNRKDEGEITCKNDEGTQDKSIAISTEPNVSSLVSAEDLEPTKTALMTDEKGQNGKASSHNMPKKAASRTSSKPKVGSWSKGVSPLSKLFTTAANNKGAKVDPKDVKRPEVKPGGGLLGKLFQSSVTDRNENAVKFTTNDIGGEDKKTPDVKIKKDTSTINDQSSDNKESKQSIETSVQDEMRKSVDQKEKGEFDQSGLDVTQTNSKSITGNIDQEESQVQKVSSSDLWSNEATTDGAQNEQFSGDSFKDGLGGGPDAESSKSNTVETSKIKDVPEQALLNDKGEPYDSICLFDQTQDIFGDISTISTFYKTALPTVEVQSTHAERNLSIFDDAFVPDQTVVNEKEIFSGMDVSGQNGNSDFNFDIFASNNTFQPSTVSDAAAKQHHFDLTDDIFGSGDFLSTDSDHKDPSITLDTSPVAVPEPLDIFGENIITSAPQPLPLSQSKDEISLLEGFSDPDNFKNKESETATSTSTSWMDDLLG